MFSRETLGPGKNLRIVSESAHKAALETLDNIPVAEALFSSVITYILPRASAHEGKQ